MDLEVVAIGTELLLGFTVDTNARTLGQDLAAIGVRVARRATVPDDPEAIREVVSEALRRTGIVLTTGGLGPTRDDITKQVVADLYGWPLEWHPAIWDALVARFTAAGRVPVAANRCQAEVPAGAVVLPNPRGTAPGLWLEGEPGLVILLPGVPREMAGLLREEVIPRLAERARACAEGAEPPAIRSLVIRTTGLPESSLAEQVAGVEERIAPLTLAYLPGIDGVDLRLTAWNLPPAEADRRLDLAARDLEGILASFAWGRGDDNLAARVLEAARATGNTLGVAESCTGGGISARLTEVPGSSDVLRGGIVAYHNAVKEDTLGVPAELLEAHGAVSAEVASAMAMGALERLGATVALSVTGIAGPGGGTPERPVGLVWFGLAGPWGIVTERHRFGGNREEIRARTAQYGLFLLLRSLKVEV